MNLILDADTCSRFLCASSPDLKCIPSNDTCNGVNDCTNGEDETNALCSKMILPHIPVFRKLVEPSEFWPVLANSSKYHTTWHNNQIKPLMSSHIYVTGCMAFADISQN